MDFSEGIPIDCRTLVVIPSLFNELNEIRELIENLEVRFLANRGAHIHFALLTDFKDARTEVLPGEEDLLRTARNGIEELNSKYNNDQEDIFFFSTGPEI